MSFCHGSSLQSSTNYRANKELFEVSEGASIKELFEVSEGTSVKRSGATVQLLTLAGGQLPAVINNQRSSQVGVKASKKAEENRENMNF